MTSGIRIRIHHLRHAIALNPHAGSSRAMLGLYLCYLGRAEEGIAETLAALALEPVSLLVGYVGAVVFMLARRFERGLEEIAILCSSPSSRSPLLIRCARIRGSRTCSGASGWKRPR